MSIPTHPRAVVTGAGGGLGRAFCVELATRGARIVASDLDLDAARETASRVGGETHALRCDVSRAPEVQALADRAHELLGGVDLVINNAGVAVAGDVGEIPLGDWEWILGVNLWGVIHGCHAFLPRLRRQKSGHILNVASMAGLLALPKMAPYNVTKAAVVALSETIYGEAKEDGVGVTVLCPTFFQTNIGRDARATDGRFRELTAAMMAHGKLTAEEVARRALDDAAAGELYSLPHADGRWAWRIKRLMPKRFLDLAPAAMRRQARKLGFDF